MKDKEAWLYQNTDDYVSIEGCKCRMCLKFEPCPCGCGHGWCSICCDFVDAHDDACEEIDRDFL